MRTAYRLISVFILLLWVHACATSGEVVTVTAVSKSELKGIDERNLARLKEIKEAKKKEKKDDAINQFIKGTPSYTIKQYLDRSPEANNTSAQDYKVGGYDVIDVIVYEEQDLSRKDVRISADGYISFPLVGRLKVDGLSTSEI
jgi:hypothetical protein